MRVVCLVPSWTETLIACGIEVVGRTRYCLHPEGAVRSIAVVGGTKDIRWKSLNDLKPDVLLVDKEENRKEVLSKSNAHYHISHVESLHDMPREMQKLIDLATDFKVPPQVIENLTHLKRRWIRIIETNFEIKPIDLPGVIEWVRRPTEEIKSIDYIIWKDPLMAVGENTFIGSVLCHLGFKNLLRKGSDKYPTLRTDDLNIRNHLYLFSSEPYPFHKEKEKKWLRDLNRPAAIVDGESYSWFGVRSLQFLESLNGLKD